jgi:Protein of unknown function (DUF2442)
MSTSIRVSNSRPIATAAAVVADRLHVTLVDGREIIVPVSWFDWLANATPEQRSELDLIEGGEGIWWEQLDEGVSVPGLLGLPHV